MPYHIEAEDGVFCVYKDGDAEALQCYDNESDADAYLTALNIATAEETKAESDTHTPPEAVADNARMALEVRAEKPPSQRGMTPVGLARARQLANRQPVSVATLRRMASYFARHEVDKDGATWEEQGKGWQAWMGWGGDEGWAWARRIIEEEDMSKKAMVMEGYSPRQDEMIAQYLSTAEDMGQWSKGISADGAHYMEENPFASQGIACKYCAFWVEGGACTIVAGSIAPEAVCKLWVIPESVIAQHAMEPEAMEEAMPEAEDEPGVEVEIEVASVKQFDAPRIIEVDESVKAYARRIIGRE
jgi:hypothetical protein